jgi:hypothetical protein
MEASVEIRQRVDTLARTGHRQRQAQATRRDNPLAPTNLRVFTGYPRKAGQLDVGHVR